MKKSMFALVATVMTLSSQNLYALEGYCAAEAKQAAEALHEINQGTKASADRVETVSYAGWKTKRYEVSIEGKEYAVNISEYESPSNPQCLITLVAAQ